MTISWHGVTSRNTCHFSITAVETSAVVKSRISFHVLNEPGWLKREDVRPVVLAVLGVYAAFLVLNQRFGTTFRCKWSKSGWSVWGDLQMIIYTLIKGPIICPETLVTLKPTRRKTQKNQHNNFKPPTFVWRVPVLSNVGQDFDSTGNSSDIFRDSSGKISWW